MRKQAKKLLSAALTIAMVAAMMLSLVSCGDKYKPDSMIYIGASGPLTGEAASYGVSVQKGAQLAIEEINEAGGVNGITFYFNMLDDQATATQAASNYDSLMDKGMQVSIGAVTTDSCEAFAAKAVNDNLFYITPSASAASVIANRPNGYRICFSDPQQGEIAAEKIVEAGYSNVGVIYQSDNNYSKGIYDAFEAKMQELGKTFTARTFDQNSNKDFSSQMDVLKDCDVIFLPMYYTEAGLIASKAAEKGCDAVLFGSDGFDGIAAVLASNVTNTIQYITPFDADSADLTVKKFVDAYKAKYNETPDQFAADGYDAVMAIYEALKKANVTDAQMSADALTKAVTAVLSSPDFSFTGATGKMTWSSDGVPTKVPQVKEITRG